MTTSRVSTSARAISTRAATRAAEQGHDECHLDHNERSVSPAANERDCAGQTVSGQETPTNAGCRADRSTFAFEDARDAAAMFAGPHSPGREAGAGARRVMWRLP